MWTQVLYCLLSAATFIVPAQSGENSASLLDSRIIDFKKNVHRILEGSRIRKKRQLGQIRDPSDYRLRFDSVTPVDLPYLSDFNLTTWISLSHQHNDQVLIGTKQGHLMLFQVSDQGMTAQTVAISDEGDIAVKAVAFSDGNEQWFSVLHSSDETYYIQVYKRVGRGLEKRQVISLPGQSDIQLITLRGVHYLVVATSKAYKAVHVNGMTHEASVVLYHWIKTQFDQIASRQTYGAQSLGCWVVGGSIYIAVGQEKNDEENYQVGSPIFFYNSKEENKLVLWQTLKTFGPTKVKHFYVAGSHYLIFIGRKDAVIYWWLNGQFMKWQTLPGTAYASDLEILSLEGEVAIVIGLKKEALFFTLDGSGFYISTVPVSFEGSTLSSLHFVQSGKAYYALALFAESQKQQSIWRLALGSVYMPSVKVLDPLQQCLVNAKELLLERESELSAIQADLGRVWLKGSNQTVSSKIVVKGNIRSPHIVEAKDVIIIRHTKLPDASMGLLINELIETKDAMDEVKEELDGVIYQSTRQEIKGLKHFSDLIYVPSLTMDSVQGGTSINGVSLEKLEKSALRKVGNQTFQNTTLISHFHADTVNMDTLDGISTDDLLLLHGRQVVTGDLTFSNVKGSSLSTRTVNYIPIEDIVTTKHSQSIRDLKAFSKLYSNVIDVGEETNGVNLEDAVKKIVSVNDLNEFHGQLTFEKPLSIQGNLFLTGQINDVVDLSKLMSQSVTIDTQQDLTGLYRFAANATIGGDLVAGTINGVSTANLLTLFSEQDIYSDVSFMAPLTVKGKLLTDFVNGVHLGDQVIRKLSPQEFVGGRKIFTKNIYADFVDMTDYATLDGVDPSALGEDIVHHKQGVIKSNSTSFKNVVVRGNLTALKGINGYEVTDLADSVWLKNVPQEITSPLVAEKLSFGNDLYVGTVNGYDLDKDIVHSYMDEVIHSTKIFHNKIVIQTGLQTAEKGTINGIDPHTLKIELDQYKSDQIIHGTKTMMSLEVLGDLHVEKLNDMPPSHIMQPHARQTVYGPVDFESEITSVSGNVNANELSFNYINGLNLEKYYNSAIVSSDPTRPITKNFAHLKGSHLSMPTGSLINGISLPHMMQRVVTLNSPQQLIAAQSFECVNFHKFINVSSLNELDFPKYLDDVVFTDQQSVISNKVFSKIVDSTNAAVEGSINGIKIEEMAANVFYKSQDNEVAVPFAFKGDVDIGDLIVNSKLDGIEMKDLILLKQDQHLGPAYFLTSVAIDGDLFVTGHLNGCDLSEVASKAIYKNNLTQVITEHVNVQTIVIDGNIHFEDAGDKHFIELMKRLITASGDQEITSDVVIDANSIVENLYLNTHAESSKLAEIMRDAVRHSVSQPIQGHKVFADVSTHKLISGNIFANKVNGVDLNELHRTTVRKNGYQEIQNDKIFARGLHANIVTAKGYLNGLILPKDAVLTDTSEHISHPTYFMSDVFITTDLFVRGLIDGVNVNELISNRVTGSGDQNITAQLTFTNDVVVLDKMTVDGTINELVLELVTKVRPDQPIHGYKLFAQLEASGTVFAPMVNGYDVSGLASKMVQNNMDDFVNGIQVFEKPIKAKSLFVEWLNNMPIQKLKETFEFAMISLNSVISYLKDFTSSLGKQLSYQLSVTQEQVSKFAYFILFQEIDMGPTVKILNGYTQRHILSDLSHSMVMWTTQKQCIYMQKCCHLAFSYWMTVQKSGIVMVDATSEPGRYYPISDSYERGFFIWTNKTDVQPQWCNAKNSKTYLALHNNDGSLEVSVELEGTPLSDIKAFRHGNNFAVASFYYENSENEYSSTVVYMYNELQQQWTKHQTIPSFEVLSLDVTEYHGHENEIILALGTGMDTLSSYSTVYKWNDKEHLFEAFQNIQSHHVTSTLWIRKGNELLLAMSSVDHWPGKHYGCAETISGGAINIYAYEEQLHWIQSIPASGIISMAPFTVEGDLFLAAASSQHQTVYIYEWKGYSSFVEAQAMFVGEVRHISVYGIDDDVYMTVALTSGPSKILKMVRKGQHVTNFQTRDPVSNDESLKETKHITGC